MDKAQDVNFLQEKKRLFQSNFFHHFKSVALAQEKKGAVGIREDFSDVLGFSPLLSCCSPLHFPIFLSKM